jgi:hypothetical protein
MNELMDIDRTYEKTYYNNKWEIPPLLTGGDEDGGSKRLYGSY